MSNALHAHTPLINVMDGRGLTVRSVVYHRLKEQDEPLARISSMTYDVAGHLVASRDPRLWALAQQDATSPANLVCLHDLAGSVLLSESVDAGWSLALQAEAGNIVQTWDTRGSTWQIQHDAALRPVTTVETDAGQNSRTLMRTVYADNSDTSAEHNQCGQLARLDDTAGSLHFAEYGILGQLLSQPRQFLKTLDLPDWTESTDYLDLVETEELTTRWQYNALGEPILQTDAKGNTQRFAYSVAGNSSGTYLRLEAQNEIPLVEGMTYNALGQVEEQTAGNGVISRAVYETSTGLLQSLTAHNASNEALQTLHYRYDPVGNILQIEDRAQPVRFFANQRSEPISHYRYDTLYQLIEATGREVNTGASHGPDLPAQQNLPPDPNQVSNYTQSYDYDPAGNLLQMRHVGAQSFTRTMRVAPDSNRSLPEGEVDADFNEAFDTNGNLQQVVRGQTLGWDLRNQLQEITTVTRTTKASDHERYIYDGQGQRCRKVNSTITSSRTLGNEVRYLPGLEIRTTADGEILHVITARNSRALHWQAGLPGGIANDQIRYELSDHLDSSTLELDQQGDLISQESYYPFGGTSWWAARSAVEAKYKTVRYSGKERDASGLYYYGLRYYAPWLQRWINPDPAGDVNGLNLFCFVANNPVRFIDDNGLTLLDALDLRVDPRVPELTQEMRISTSLAASPSVSDRRRNFSAETKAILSVAAENTKHFNSLHKSQQQKLLRLDRLTLATLKTGVAHAGVTTQDNSMLLSGFINYQGSLSPRSLFPGVSLIPQKEPIKEPIKTIPHLAHFIPRLTTQNKDTNVYKFFTTDTGIPEIKEDEHYRISDMEAYMDAVKTAYSSGEQPLHPFMETQIRQHVEESNFMIPSKAGIPGMHAEVQALNRLLNERAPTGQNVHKVLAESYLFTKRLTGNKDMPGSDFPACFNCSGIIPPFVHVITGRVEQIKNTRKPQKRRKSL
ncbi:RHS repeat-associated core domain-containing protein [Pseudomonas lijiangensis]|uniref:RHS repeat-associated core domain-containing protein n=1 Tax=Pseudomonas lijiangensis TaxID=2995658 RepID=UPI0031BACB9C